MAKRVNDPGTGTRNTANRLVDKNGRFNIRRIGGLGPLADPYYYLVNVSRGKFLLLVCITYTVMNTVFALIYLGCGVENLNGIEKGTLLSDFLNCFFFSAQSLTTVGYGNISPNSHLTQLVASIEGLVGILNFAIITGILFGRFSKPEAHLKYSTHALVAPFEEGKAIMLRLASRRNHILINANSKLTYSSLVTQPGSDRKRDYFEMPLQLDNVSAMPLSWTLVHPLDDKSPLYNKSLQQMKEEEGEILVQFNAFDDTFHETVYSRFSYTAAEIIENAAFERAFETIDGMTVLDLDKIDLYRTL